MSDKMHNLAQVSEQELQPALPRLLSLIPFMPSATPPLGDSTEQPDWPSPTLTETTETVVLETTSRCNLRCTYCSVSQPDYHGSDLSSEQEDFFFQGLSERPPELLVLNGHGETTIIPGWEQRYKRFIDRFCVGITSNFAKIFSDSELEVLSRFKSLNISLDTHDAELLANVRRRVRLENILENLANIRATAASRGRPCPEIHIFCTVYDKNVFHLDSFAEFLVSLGVTAVHWGNLMRHPDISDGLNVNVLPSLSTEKQREAYRVIERAGQILRQAGISVGHWGDNDYFEAMKDALHTDNELQLKDLRQNIVVDDAHSVMLWEKSFVQPCTQGETRDCLDPWNYAHLEASGGVLPCCVRGGPIGKVDAEHSLAAVLNNQATQELRKNLLSGSLDPECASCAVRSPISLPKYRRRVLTRYIEAVLRAKEHSPLFRRAARRILAAETPERRWKKQLFFVLRNIVPQAALRFLAGAYPADIPQNCRHLIAFQNVRRGYFGLSERIHLRPNRLGKTTATLNFNEIDLTNIKTILLSSEARSKRAIPVRFRCSIYHRDSLCLAKEIVLTNEEQAWTVPVEELLGPHTITLQTQLCKKHFWSAPPEAYFDYPLLEML